MTDDPTRPGTLELAQASGSATASQDTASQDTANQDTVTVTQPPDGGEVILPSPAGRLYDLKFDPRLAQMRVVDADGDGDLDVVLLFNADTPQESRIVFVDMVEASQSGLAPALQVGEQRFEADNLVRQAQALAGEAPTLEIAAAPGTEAVGTGATQYDDNLGALIDLLNPQDVIPGVEMAFPSIDPDETEDDETDDFLAAATAGDDPGGGGDPGGGDDPGGGGDPDTGDVPEASIVGAPVVAESEFAEFTILLSNPSDFDSTLNVTVSDSGSGTGFATGGTVEPADYLNTTLEVFDGTSWVPFANGSSVTVPAGDTSLQVRVTTLDDAGNPIFEGPEVFQIALSDAGDAGVTVNTTPAVGTINDDDSGDGGDPGGGGDPDTGDVPEASIVGAPVVAESEFAEFTILLSNPSDFDSTLNVTVSDSGSGTGFATGGTVEPADYLNTTLEVFDGTSWVPFANGSSVTVPAGDTSLPIRVTTLDDAGNPIFEGPEVFQIALSDAGDTGVTVNTTPAVGTISDDDSGDGGDPGGGGDPGTGDVPEASIVGAPVVAESEFAEFTILLSNPSDFDSTLNVTVSDSGSGTGFATGGTVEPADYLNTTLEVFDGTSWVPFANGSSVTVPAGDTSLQVRVTTLDDAGNPIFEGPEVFQIALSDAGDAGVTVNTTPAVGTINDDDSGDGGDPGGGGDPGTSDVPEASIVGAPVVAESEFAEFTILLSNPSDFDSTLNVTVSDSGSGVGFATGGTGEPADYLDTTLEVFDGTSWVPFANGSSVTVLAGETALQVRVTTFDDAGNPIFEGPEVFQIALSDAGDAGVTVNTTPAIGTISDDDSGDGGDPGGGGDPDTGDVPDAIIGDASADEGERLVFTVALSNPSFEAITLALSTAGSGVNPATDGIDYENVNFEVSANGVDWVAADGANATEITFAPGATQLFVGIDSFLDDLNEMDETFTLSATATAGTVGTVTSGTGTIIDTTPILVVGSDGDDDGTTGPTHTVPNPTPDAPDEGAIVGGGGPDVLIGDPGGAEVFGQFNVSIVTDVTGSIGPDNIATLNAAVEDLAQQIIDRGIADRTVLSLITFAVRDGQATPGLVSSKSFTWDGSQFVAADGQSLADAIDTEVADPIGRTDFEPALQEAADFFNGLNGGSGPEDDDINRIFFLTDGQDNTPPDIAFDPDNVPDLYGPSGLIAEEDLQVSVFGLESSGGVNSGFDPDQLNLLDDGLPPQPGEPLHEGDPPPVDQVEADIAVIGFDELDSALSDELLTILLNESGSDVIGGGGGGDIIFGDVPNSDALAAVEGIDLPLGSGFLVFQALEAGGSSSSPGWDRDDTIAYLRDPANQSALIGAGRGAGDTIDGGAGDDVIFGQGGDDSLTGGAGADTFVYTLAADEDDDEILDFSTAEGDLLSFVNVSDTNSSGTIGIEDVVDSFVDGGGPGAVDTLVLASGTTIAIVDVDGVLSDLNDVAANSLVNSAMA